MLQAPNNRWFIAAGYWQLAAGKTDSFENRKARGKKQEAIMPTPKISLCFANHILSTKSAEGGKNQIARQLKGNTVALMAFDEFLLG